MAPFAARTGKSLRAETVSGLLFTRTRYSRFPTRVVPAGRMRFWAFRAFETSIPERCFAYIAFGSKSTIIWRLLPPQGKGMEAPWTVAKRVDSKRVFDGK